ncbi:MAG: NAD(FAD)-utilizing dehydrogenase [Eubacteriales bacterium]|nr:NAD(FAD)-utilizing dehydrogenase [Eubacteriales bacterium]MDD3198715.1 NAD(FAD)-utilizing dehydrogenase [Eubacteriales bacterium]MDD4121889.1 NAD(FAD)-utilizing dehydrogenase [Eubacteriales bacterium]MDD4629039.1 NAD(FAD)-utilizing dehydrogenase [Eubacteriales bacterium]
MLRIHEIKLDIGEELDVIPDRIIKKLGVGGLKIESYQLIKESVDARNKSDIKMVYSVDFIPYLQNKKTEELENQLLKTNRNIRLERTPEMSYAPITKGQEIMIHRPVIAGFGPCGMFAALILSELGYEPIIIERGKPIEERIRDVNRFWQDGLLDPESNVQFGEGGAGLFSDGKLTSQIRDPRVRKVLEEFVEAGAAPEILYKQKPHIGTDVLRRIVLNIRKKIINNGGEILFSSRLTSLDISEGNDRNQIRGILVNNDRIIETDDLILAIGHSARDTFRLLDKTGIPMVQKPFSVGVRIEHPQSLVNEAQYGKNWRNYNFGAADYKLSYHCKNGRGVYTFCMCPGGYVIGAASQAGTVVTNGMSLHNRGSLFSNSALLVDVRTEDFPDTSTLAGIAFQERYERLAFQAGGRNYNAPAQRLKDFLQGSSAFDDPGDHKWEHALPEPTYKPGITWTDLTACLPDFAVEAMREAIPVFGRKLQGFDWGDSVMTGVETRSSSPVRILRDGDLMSQIKGIYPSGEGAGYAGGIVSAAVDGIRVAEEIVKKKKGLRSSAV